MQILDYFYRSPYLHWCKGRGCFSYMGLERGLGGYRSMRATWGSFWIGNMFPVGSYLKPRHKYRKTCNWTPVLEMILNITFSTHCWENGVEVWLVFSYVADKRAYHIRKQESISLCWIMACSLNGKHTLVIERGFIKTLCLCTGKRL